MSKKTLTKNEFRMDNNPSHFGKENQPHPAYISKRKKHMLFANTITHSRISNGVSNFDIAENPNKKSKDKRQTRISPPFWQNEKQFSTEKLKHFRFSNKTRKQIKKINKKFKQ